MPSVVGAGGAAQTPLLRADIAMSALSKCPVCPIPAPPRMVPFKGHTLSPVTVRLRSLIDHGCIGVALIGWAVVRAHAGWQC